MATISKHLPLIALFLMLANKLVHSQDHTFFSYHSFAPPDGLIFQGNAFVVRGSNNLLLTQLFSSGLPWPTNAGRVLFSRPVKFWERGTNRQAFFETTITFRITPSSSNGAAEGLTFFIAPVGTTMPSGATGPNLGIFNSSGIAPALFAVEFDTLVNGDWDPNFRHIGIDIESRMSKNVARFDSGTGELVRATIIYRPDTKRISVLVEQHVLLEYMFDLKTILPEQVQVGISSSAGANASELGIHEVISWSFFSDLRHYDDNNKAYMDEGILEE